MDTLTYQKINQFDWFNLQDFQNIESIHPKGTETTNQIRPQTLQQGLKEVQWSINDYLKKTSK